MAGRVGGIEEVILLHGARDAEVGATGLHADKAVFVIGFQHSIHPRHTEDDAIRRGQRPPGQRSARTARHDRHAHLVTDAQDVRDVLCGRRQHRHHRRAAIGRQRIAFIGTGFSLQMDDGIGRQNGQQPLDKP